MRMFFVAGGILIALYAGSYVFGPKHELAAIPFVLAGIAVAAVGLFKKTLQ